MEVPLNVVPEQKSEGGGVHFEPGIHPFSQSENAAVFNAFYNGDLEMHMWNKEVDERIASYAYAADALLLTVD
jgi:hypothetical protein